MKLFYSPGSCSLAIHILLEEIGKPYQLELVSVSEGKTQSKEYLSINPKGRVPVLEIEQKEILTELPAISFYLAKTNADFGLIPNDLLLEARCIEWFNWLSGTVHALAFGEIWRPTRFIKNEKIFSQISENGRGNVLQHYFTIEKQLENKKWAVGQNYSVVDPYLLVFYYWGFRIGLKMHQMYPSWSQHAGRLLERCAVISALEQEDITIPNI